MKMIYKTPEIEVTVLYTTLSILEDSGEIGSGNGGDGPGILTNQNNTFVDDDISTDLGRPSLWED